MAELVGVVAWLLVATLCCNEYIGILPLSLNDCSRAVTHPHPHDQAESSRVIFGCTAVQFCDGES